MDEDNTYESNDFLETTFNSEDSNSSFNLISSSHSCSEENLHDEDNRNSYDSDDYINDEEAYLSDECSSINDVDVDAYDKFVEENYLHDTYDESCKNDNGQYEDGEYFVENNFGNGNYYEYFENNEDECESDEYYEDEDENNEYFEENYYDDNYDSYDC